MGVVIAFVVMVLVIFMVTAGSGRPRSTPQRNSGGGVVALFIGFCLLLMLIALVGGGR